MTIGPFSATLAIALAASLVISSRGEARDGFSAHRRERRDFYEKKAARAAREALERCASTEKTPLRHQGRYPRSAPESYDFGKATYFSGKGEILRLKLPKALDMSHDLPRAEFTIEAWLKPEGGQKNQTTIIGLVDTCGMWTADKGWSIGIHSLANEAESDARVYFSLRTDRSRESTTISANQRYQPNRWVHVAASYDGARMALFINGAKVGVSHRQRGDLFSRTASRCKELDIGGNVVSGTYYRGLMDEVLLWSEARSHAEIKDSMHSTSRRKENHSTLDHYEDFSNIDAWEMVMENQPVLVQSDMPTELHDVHVVAPKCGMTVCDSPDIVKSYSANWALRRPKTIRYRVVNVYDDDGANPVVTEEQIAYQHQHLNAAFRRHNITWELTVANVTNSHLKSRAILVDCPVDSIGDRRCDPQCRHAQTGFDGGDCDVPKTICRKSQIGDGQCDDNCNRRYHDWDGGDCCQPPSTSASTAAKCFDPRSPYRMYMDLNEYKTALGLNSSTRLNVYFASWTSETVLGIATYPWEKTVFDTLGGVVLKPDHYGIPGMSDSTIHEFGHVLGLWHVHHGVSEMDCTDECLETHPSLELGDMVEDTNPTPSNTECRDPQPCEYDSCGLEMVYKDTPYRNFMSYADDDCTNSFTPQQNARMHCYIDLMYRPWQSDRAPSPVPMPPTIISVHRPSTIVLAWVPPLSGNLGGPGSECNQCLNDNTLEQYASTAYSPNPSRGPGLWDPKQALGPPDAESCAASTKAWMPDPADGVCDDCYIELGFQIPVVPIQLSLWVAWYPTEGVKDLVLVFIDGTEESLGGEIDAYCDMPFTTRVDVNKKVMKVRVHTREPFVSIDAVQIVSGPDNPVCQPCKPVRYVVHRSPPLSTGESTVIVNTPRYTDSDVVPGSEFTYQIQAMQGSKTSELSPPLVYIHGQKRCGDGIIDSSAGEECDDGNAVDGDGCSLSCRKNEFFHCEGEPSLCYLHDGDGVCEEFERHFSIRDCGFYTPPGYSDQWASTARANPAYQTDECPESVVIGPPAHTQKCGLDFDPATSWHPCNPDLNGESFWLRVGFQTPVIATTIIVYLASDGIDELKFSPEAKSISVELIDTAGESHPLGDREIFVFCKDNPIHINVLHDLSKPFYKTEAALIKFRSSHVTISAVVLRSHDGLDPATISQCANHEVYNPHTRQCSAYQCKKPACDKLNIKHADLECSREKDFEEGDVCRVHCDFGYVPSSTQEVMCVDGEWEGSASLGCLPIDCKMPVITNADVVCSDGTTYGKECTFKCTPPAKLQGTDNKLVCEADGLYSLPEAFCQLVCDTPDLPPNSALVTQKCQEGGLNVGESCKFRCKLGYHVKGMAKRKRTFRLDCGEDAEWKGDTCERVTCDPPSALYNGMYNCSDGFYFGSECKLKCPGETGEIDKSSNSIVCGRDGTWEGSFKGCKLLQGECSPPSSKVVEFKCKGNSIGDKCTVSCKTGGDRPALVDVHAENGVIETEEVICTAQKRWHPEPAAFVCMEPCSRHFIGDGFCDGVNNRAYCDWDGGDCCASTAGKEVQPFPEDCTTECVCLDPNAAENRDDRTAAKKRENLTQD